MKSSGPGLIRRGTGPRVPPAMAQPFAPTPSAQREPFFAIEPLDSFVVRRVTFSRAASGRARITPAPSFLRKLRRHSRSPSRLLPAPFNPGRTSDPDQPTGATLPQPVAIHYLSPLLRLAAGLSVFSQYVLERREVRAWTRPAISSAAGSLPRAAQPAHLRYLRPPDLLRHT